MADDLERPVLESGALPPEGEPETTLVAPARAREPQANFFDQFDNEPDAGEPGLWERARLNAIDAYYQGTILGAAQLTRLSELAYPTSDVEVEPATRKWAKQEYDRIVAELIRYNSMRGFSTTAEGAFALAGQLAGTAPSPESLIGVGGRGATLLMRTLSAAGGAAAVNVATDPIVQMFNI